VSAPDLPGGSGPARAGWPRSGSCPQSSPGSGSWYSPPTTLSARATEVLILVGRGLTNAQIGRELFVSQATVKTHLLRSYAKLGVSGRTAAVTRAMELGVLPSPGRP
jgi:ATP/maltotriose-dependent transcriptional regulator MalT